LGQLIKYRERFLEAGIQLAAVSTDAPARNTLLRKRLKTTIPFISDPRGSLLRKLRILHRKGSPTGGDIAVPSHFLVAADGKIAWIYNSDTWRQRLPASQVLTESKRALDSV